MKAVEIVVGGVATIVTYMILSILFVAPVAALMAIAMGTAIAITVRGQDVH